MKKLIIIIALLLIISPAITTALPVLAQAEDEATLEFNPAESDESLGNSEDVNLGREQPLTIASGIINAVLGLLGVLFLALMLWGGFTWMNARGNEEDVAKAKKIITMAVIGLVIILASFGISQFIYSQLGNETQTETQ